MTRDANAASNLANWPGLSFPCQDVETAEDRLSRRWLVKRHMNPEVRSGLQQT